MLADDDFSRVVRDTPLVSIDLVPIGPDGQVLVGLRTNEPAKGTWFVPGGRVRKDETLAAAFARLTRDELGVEHPIAAGRFLGVFEHLYPTNRFGDPSFGTHYIVLAYALPLPERLSALPHEQHASYRWLDRDELASRADVHPNTRVYAAHL